MSLCSFAVLLLPMLPATPALTLLARQLLLHQLWALCLIPLVHPLIAMPLLCLNTLPMLV
jgi:hypothetical protein